MYPTHAISIFSSVSNNCRFFSTPVFWAKADAKIQPFSIPPKYFFKKIYYTPISILFIKLLHYENFFFNSPSYPLKLTFCAQKSSILG